MIFGIGTDICDVRRIRAVLGAPRRSLRRARPRAERARRLSRPPRPVRERGVRYLATRFSAKEAFSKAIGLGMRTPMTWRGCEVAKQPSGKPEIRLHGALADWFSTRRLRAHVSVTDEADYAASFVVVEQESAR